MEHAQLDSNPFALMLDPAAVFLAMEKSDRLSRLQSRICRPLDKIAGAPTAEDAAEVAEADDVIIGGFAITVS
jgi:hypothetical protein